MIHNPKLALVSLLFLLTIPFIGFFSSEVILRNFNKNVLSIITKDLNNEEKKNVNENAEKFSVQRICKEPDASFHLCNSVNNIILLNKVSIWSLFGGLSLLILLVILGFVARNSRKALLYLFKPGLKLTQFSIVVLMVSHAGIIMASAYYMESYWIGRVHFILIGGIGLIVGHATLRIVIFTLKGIKKPESSIFGKIVQEHEQPRLWDLIKKISNRLKTYPPDNVVVGMSPTFFVTEANVNCIDGKLSGRTLYISLPLCRILKSSELSAILYHEFGHYIGDDTKFSQYFYPIYRGAHILLDILSGHMVNSSNEGNTGSIALLPSFYILSYFMDAFRIIESKISREREIIADKVAADNENNSTIASSLIKVHAYSQVWNYIEKQMIESLKKDEAIVNVSKLFEVASTNLPNDTFTEELGKKYASHPTDTHPSLSERLEALGVKLTNDLLNEALSVPDNSVSLSFENLENLEVELSELENAKIMRIINAYQK